LPLPPADEAVLLGLRDRLRDPGLLRRAERGSHRLRHPAGLGGPYRHAVLLRLLLADHADRRPDRNAQEASTVHRAIRARRFRRQACRVRNTMRLTKLSRNLALGLTLGLLGSSAAMAADSATARHHPTDAEFSFEGPFGTYDRAALQRGSQVYKDRESVVRG